MLEALAVHPWAGVCVALWSYGLVAVIGGALRDVVEHSCIRYFTAKYMGQKMVDDAVKARLAAALDKMTADGTTPTSR